MSTQSPTAGESLSGLRDDAGTIGHAAANRVHREVDLRKGAAVEQVKTLSSALGSAADRVGSDRSEWLRSAFQQGAQALERLARTVDQKDSRQLSNEVKQLARTNPVTFLGGCAMAGFAAARVIKAGGGQPVDEPHTPPSDPYALSSDPLPITSTQQTSPFFQSTPSASTPSSREPLA